MWLMIAYAMQNTQIIAQSFHIQSPDPEDDYLFDLALSSHSKILVTGEKPC